MIICSIRSGAQERAVAPVAGRATRRHQGPDGRAPSVYIYIYIERERDIYIYI